MKSDHSITKLEIALIVGIIGCLLLATWEFMNLMGSEWLKGWVDQNEFTNRRIILYGTAFTLSISAIMVALRTINRDSRFIYAINRALLWYGSLLLISTIAVFVFDCLPEIAAGIIGAVIFAYTIYALQKRYFSEERILSSRRENGECLSCGHPINEAHDYCTHCGVSIKKECPSCQRPNLILALHCGHCGAEM